MLRKSAEKPRGLKGMAGAATRWGCKGVRPLAAAFASFSSSEARDLTPIQAIGLTPIRLCPLRPN
jgi:hypothetical protein